ncbi:hypothetical protein HFN89_04900 [Rhizobium laguerreae]|nr:hypothetical protein [Rhizobium laguerreae]
MSDPSFRYKSLSPDFRRDPKTACYCALCQKDIKGEPKFYAHMIDGCAAAVHPQDREIANREVPDHDNFGLLPVGPDCAKVIGMDFVYTAEQAAVVKDATLDASVPKPATPSFKI